MDDRELLIRIDRHLETTSEYIRQGNEYMRRGNEHMERGNELMQANREAFAETREAFQDVRGALREMNLRSERVMGELSAQIREMTEEARAQRGALLAILDRLGAGPAPEAT